MIGCCDETPKSHALFEVVGDCQVVVVQPGGEFRASAARDSARRKVEGFCSWCRSWIGGTGICDAVDDHVRVVHLPCVEVGQMIPVIGEVDLQAGFLPPDRIFNIRPIGKERVEIALEAGEIPGTGRGDQVLGILLEGGVLGHRHPQVGDFAEAAQRGKVEHLIVVGEAVRHDIGCLDLREIEQDFPRLGRRSVGQCHGCGLDDAVSVDSQGRRGRIYADRGDARFAERLELAGVGYAVPIQVTPGKKLAEIRILGVDDAIAIGVKGRECLVPRFGRRTEQLRDVINLPVPVTVDRQQTIIGCNPRRAFRKAVAVEIEARIRTAEGCQFKAIAVEIDDKRIDGRRVPLGNQVREPVGILFD
ncbi:hypothetical protein SDC9_62676 [bioreactor metagenome]|uniref:Uncharacterized protein n=1 Tax=bioreactor metagenome TaxID=1076179 RepID=A0A644XKL2_9ZZZZ